MQSVSNSNRYSRHIITGLLMAALILIASYAVIHNWLAQPLAITDDQTIEFESGSSIRAFASKLKQAGLLSHPNLFRFWTRLQRIDTRLKAGEYELRKNDTLLTLLEKMLQGDVKQYSITIVEGWTFKQMMQAVNKHPQIRHSLQDLDQSQIMSQLGLSTAENELHAEGQFLPDTYFIYKNTKDTELLLRANTAMQQTLQRHWSNRQQNLPIKTAYQALTLASIIEKESAVAEERPVIAGVFINRLRKKMRLQTDPTVIYGMGDKYDGDIRFRDLRRDTPYNTYTRKGLPPTPIAMPGSAAIAAAVQPAKTDYLYFVATSDRSGKHAFSSTLVQHEKLVDIHQRGK